MNNPIGMKTAGCQRDSKVDFVTILVVLLAGFTLLLSIHTVRAQQGNFRFDEIRTINGPCCTDEGTDLVVDDEGSVLISGYRGSLDLDHDGEIDIPTFGRPDAFVSKVNLVDGTIMEWTRGPGGPKLDRADGITSDGHGGVYIVGMFTDQLQMTETTILHSAGGSDGFLARYGRDSQLIWGLAIGGAGEDRFWDVTSDSNGNVILIGTVIGPVDVDRDGTIDLFAGKDGQALIVSFSPGGEFRWIRPSGGDAGAWGMAITSGPNNEVYAAGWYQNGTPDFDDDGQPDLPVADETTAAVKELQDGGLYEYNGFYVKLDENGSPLWVKGVSGPRLQVVSALGIAANGDLLVLGGYTAAPDFDGDGLPDLEHRSVADRMWKYDVNANNFLMQVTPDGEQVWIKRYTAPAKHVAVSGRHIVLSGFYSGTLDVDDDDIPERESDGDDEREGFSLILDHQGEVQQVLTVVGDHHDIVNAAGFSPDGNTLYLTGFTSLGADFDGDGKVETASVCHKAGEIYLAVFKLEEPN